LAFQVTRLFGAKLEHEIDWKTTDVSLYGAVQVASRNAVERRKIKIEHHLLSANSESRSGDVLNGSYPFIHLVKAV